MNFGHVIDVRPPVQSHNRLCDLLYISLEVGKHEYDHALNHAIAFVVVVVVRDWSISIVRNESLLMLNRVCSS